MRLWRIYREIRNIWNRLDDDRMIEPFNVAIDDAQRIISDYERGVGGVIPIQLSNRFTQARDGYIQAAIRRIDAEFVDVIVDRDREQFIHLNEIEDREYEIFRNIYADIRNRTHNIRPFMQILNDAEGTVEDYENTAMRRARDREFGGGAPAAGPLFGGEDAPEADQQCVLQ